jgi:hypothetical protein
VTGNFKRRVEQFWHCAASLKHEDRYSVPRTVSKI